MTRRLALIPARGGSKRLPRKNVLPFAGRPMIAHTIEAAQRTALFDRIVVSTEDPEIADISTRFGAGVDSRPAELASDSATVVGVCREFLKRESIAGRSYDVLCCLYPTAPLRNAADIEATVELLEPGACDFSMAVTQYGHYAHQALRIEADGFLSPMWPEIATLRSDVVGHLVVGNGSTYCAHVPAFLARESFYGSRIRGYQMPIHRSVDIDTEEDYEMALALRGMR